MVAVLFRDAKLSFLTTPPTTPPPRHTLPTQHRKRTMTDPSDSFMVMLRCRLHLKVIAISCRPSDGVAVAVRSGIPIFAEEDLLDAVGKVVPTTAPDNAEEIIDDFRDFIDSIKPEDFQG